MMRWQDANHPSVLPLLAFLVLAAALAFLYTQQQDQLNARTAASRDARLVICREIEELKASERESALESYRRLDESLKLLGIRRTPAIVAAAQRNRDERLRRFAAYPGGCAAFAENPDPGAVTSG